MRCGAAMANSKKVNIADEPSDPQESIEIGIELNGGWIVVEKCGPERCGRYSFGFIVKNHDGRSGFLKALNYDAYLLSDNPAEILKAALDAFHDESRLLRLANDMRLDRVIRLFDGNTIRTAKGRGTCSYLIFELAEADGRQQLDASRRVAYFESIRMLHDVAVGVWQLHEHRIAHQDIRAANVLCFGTRRAKIGDLGKAVDPSATADHVDEIVPGDETYAAPELLYNSASPDWSVRRFGADLYLLGSLIVTFFMGTGMTPQMLANVPENLRPAEWRGMRYADVLPYLNESAARVFYDLRKQLVAESRDERWADEVVQIVRQLCNPDPMGRGDPIAHARGVNPYSLERFLGKLDRLTRRVENLRRRPQ
jgi:serine/threonine protein kinase